MYKANQFSTFTQEPIIEKCQGRFIGCHGNVKAILFGNKGVIKSLRKSDFNRSMD